MDDGKAGFFKIFLVEGTRWAAIMQADSCMPPGLQAAWARTSEGRASADSKETEEEGRFAILHGIYCRFSAFPMCRGTSFDQPRPCKPLAVAGKEQCPGGSSNRRTSEGSWARRASEEEKCLGFDKIQIKLEMQLLVVS